MVTLLISKTSFIYRHGGNSFDFVIWFLDWKNRINTWIGFLFHIYSIYTVMVTPLIPHILKLYRYGNTFDSQCTFLYRLCGNSFDFFIHKIAVENCF